MVTPLRLEYVSLDGKLPTPSPRGKDQFLFDSNTNALMLRLGKKVPSLIKEWDWDGSSTNQSEGTDSDVLLRPVYVVRDPLEDNSLLVWCEVFSFNGTPHPSNSRAHLRKAIERLSDLDVWLSPEQEYTLWKNDRYMGWPKGDPLTPPEQGRFYCSYGTKNTFGRDLSVAHRRACHKAGILICGTNAEVAPGQWEFQLRPMNPLEAADQLWLARTLLCRLSEDFGLEVKFEPKLEAKLNGSGCHVNFSDKRMREAGGLKHIEEACDRLETNYSSIVKVCGADNDLRLTGEHETAKIDKFQRGVKDRGASVRIPGSTYTNGCGRGELRTPASNMDPYKVYTAMIESIWGTGFNPETHGWTHPDHKYL